MKTVNPTALTLAITGSLALSACGGAGDIEAPEEGQTAGQNGEGQTEESNENNGDANGGATGTLTTSWAPSDTDWYLYGAQSMAIIEENSDLDITVQESSGSEENAIRMDEGAVDIGMVDVGGAERALGEHELSTLYPLSVVLWQLIVAQDSGIESVSNLDGQSWNPGPVGGGSTQTTMDVLEGMGIQPDYYEATLSDAVSAYAGRQTEGFSYRGAGVQATGAVLEASSSRPIDLLGFTDEEMEQVQEVNPDLMPVTLPGGTYSDVPDDVQTFGYWGVIVGANGEVDEETAYTVTKTFWENIDEVNEQLPQTEGLTPQVAIDELVLPLHPGAARYYEEEGLSIPEDMIAQQ